MWQSIQMQLDNALNNTAEWSAPERVCAGDIAHFRLSNRQASYFIKVAERRHLARFETEQAGLQLLAHSQFTVPEVIITGVTGKRSFIAMQWLTISQQGDWFDYGQKLAELHHTQQAGQYGWDHDNFIGATPQQNSWQNNWSVFFAEQRVGMLLQYLAERGHWQQDIDPVVDNIKRLLAGHKPVASLLHGDLWSGNAGFVDTLPCLYDPACYYGDRETDLAMSQLFGGFPNAFYQGYQNRWPLEDNYQWRKPVYQLYHLLNHWLLFGDSYQAASKQLLKEISTV